MSKLAPVSQTTVAAYELPDSDLDIFNKDYARSLYNLVPDYFRECMDKVPKEYLLMSEHELEKMATPHVTVSRIRIAFWTEYDRAQATNTKFRMSSVYSAVCSKEQFYQKIMSDPVRVAWIICPPADYMVAMKEVLLQGIKVMREIVMAKNIVDENGNLHAKNAAVVLQAVEMAHVRVHGAPVIRTETRSVNLNVNQGTPLPSAGGKSLAELQAEIKNIEKQINQGPQVIDVTPNE